MAAKQIKFMGMQARAMKPTLKHRPAMWGGILGTVYASNGQKAEYFDYDYDAAKAFAGVTEEGDLRMYNWDGKYGYPGMGIVQPKVGTKVLWVLK